MGRTVVIAAMVAALVMGGPLAFPSGDVAEAQSGCSCFASVDAIDSDLQYVDRYYTSTFINVPSEVCGTTCDAWRRNWFYFTACDYPRRINRGRNAWWGYDDGLSTVDIGPETWFCPMPPP
jgi:hypothetical protein